MTTQEFMLPDVGEGLTEAEIVGWHVSVGDRVEIDQVIVDIETAKSVVELPCPWPGTVTALLVAEGETVAVGAPIIRLSSSSDAGDGGVSDDGPTAPPVSGPLPATSPEADVEVPQPVLVGYGVTASPRRRITVVRHPRPSVVPVTGRPRVKPPVRHLARQHGVDLGELARRFPGTEITRDMVLGVSSPSLGRIDVDTAGETLVPVRGVRKATAAAMVASAFSAPHVTVWKTVDMTETMRLVRRIRTDDSFDGVRVGPLVFVAKALAAAVVEHPEINASWDEANQQIRLKHDVNLGLAVATPRGLLVPNVKGAQRLGLADLGRAMQEVIDEARANRAAAANLSGGTITITNLGTLDLDGGTPIINPGEAAILSFGAVRETVRVVDGEICVRSVAQLTLSFDHRLADGLLGGAVLSSVGAMLEDPAVGMLRW